MTRGLLLFMLLASPMLHAGEVYRWVDSKGAVIYSDQPPPGSAKPAQKVQGKGNVVEVDKESYETRLARETNPVVLYTTNCGPVCDQARDHLTQRGVPFTIRDPAKDVEIAVELKKLIGSVEVPVIRVGKSHVKGFESVTWDNILDVAGYPKTPLLPPKP